MKPRSGMTQQRASRINRRKQQGKAIDRRAESDRRKNAIAGGKPNPTGTTQGQNGEQGNTINPRNAQPIGKPAH